VRELTRRIEMETYYHGTNENWTEFDSQRACDGMHALWLTSESDYAEHFGDTIKEFDVDMDALVICDLTDIQMAYVQGDDIILKPVHEWVAILNEAGIEIEDRTDGDDDCECEFWELWDDEDCGRTNFGEYLTEHYTAAAILAMHGEDELAVWDLSAVRMAA
jgi:hypothetical protein